MGDLADYLNQPNPVRSYMGGIIRASTTGETAMTIIPGTIPQFVDGRCWLAVLWVDGVLTSISGEEPRESRNAASRAAWRAGRRLFASRPRSSAVVLRRFNAGEEEALMAKAEISH
jgi:hypothetical protein